jgi:phage/plasmid-like protein (TIGR03299 family)
MDSLEISNLNWGVYLDDVFTTYPGGSIQTIPGQHAVIRDDTHQPLAIVGDQFRPYQNKDLFSFLDAYLSDAGARIDACGHIRGGRVVWATAYQGETEYVHNDPIKKFLIIRNYHDGTGAVQVGFSDVRIVCNNALIAMFNNATCKFNVQHTLNVHAKLDRIGTLINGYRVYDSQLSEIMKSFAQKQLTQKDVLALTRQLTGPAPKSGDEDFNRAGKAILELVETGRGTDIPGVRGTGYGWLNAVTEYADHHRDIRPGNRSPEEARFESVIAGTSARLKQNAFDLLLAA